MLNYNTFYF